MKHNTKRMISAVTMSVLLAASAVSFSADAVTRTRKYYKYNLETGTVTDYNLAQDEGIPNTTSRSVIGPDDRFRDGNTAIVKVNGATGFIVSDHVIATAAHCVSKSLKSTEQDKEGTAPTAEDFIDFQVYMYSSNGIHNGVKLDPVEIHIPAERRTTDTTQKQKFDYALITVSEDLSEYGKFNLGYVYDTNNANLTNVPVLSTGFPGLLNDNNNTEALMYTGYGHLYAPTAAQNPIDGLLYYDIDIEAGQSGGPIYTITEYTVGDESYSIYTAVSLSGVGGSNMNWGPRFDSQIIQFYLSNPNISY